MMLLRLSVFFLCTGLVSIQAEESISHTTIGTNPELSAGARALQIHNYEEGLRLTLSGLNSATTLRNRAGAFSNLCAAYVGTRRYEEALESCNRSLDLNERSWRVYNNRALALLGVGRVAAARADVDKGLMLHPTSPTLARVADLVEEQARRRLVAEDRSTANH